MQKKKRMICDWTSIGTTSVTRMSKFLAKNRVVCIKKGIKYDNLYYYDTETKNIKNKRLRKQEKNECKFQVEFKANIIVIANIV